MIRMHPDQQHIVNAVAFAIRSGHKEITLRLPAGSGASVIAVALANLVNGVLVFKQSRMGAQLRYIAGQMGANAWAAMLDHRNTFKTVRGCADIAIVTDDVRDFTPPPGFTVVRITVGAAVASIAAGAPTAQPLNHEQRNRVHAVIMQPMLDRGMLAVEWKVPDGAPVSAGRHDYRAPGVAR